MPDAGSPRPDDQPEPTGEHPPVPSGGDVAAAGTAPVGDGAAPDPAAPGGSSRIEPVATGPTAEPAAGPAADPAAVTTTGTTSEPAAGTASDPAAGTTDDGAHPTSHDTSLGAQEDPDDAPAPRRGLLGRGVGVPAMALLGVLALLAVAGTAYLAWDLRRESRVDAARSEAVQAARDAARLLFSYDHTRLEDDFEAGLAVTTGDFREEYQRTTREVVTPVATEYDAVVQAEVVEAGVVSAETDRAVTLVYVNQTTTSTRVEGPKIDQSRVQMALREVDGQWLVERVDAL